MGTRQKKQVEIPRGIIAPGRRLSSRPCASFLANAAPSRRATVRSVFGLEMTDSRIRYLSGRNKLKGHIGHASLRRIGAAVPKPMRPPLRDRKFADSLLEEVGFELVVPPCSSQLAGRAERRSARRESPSLPEGGPAFRIRLGPAKSQLRTRSRFKRPPLFVEAGEHGSGR